MRLDATPAGPASLSVTDLAKSYGEAVAVDRIAFEIKAGMLGTFLGPSGCGKTTTLRMVAGLERPDRGSIVLGGETLFGPKRPMVPPEQRRIGMVFQSYAVWPHMTAAENVAFPLKVRRLPRIEIEAKVNAALGLVRLDALSTRYPGELSGGQQQRVALARAIVYEPRLLLLDEPLSNLDAALREEMRFEIRALQQRLGITALFVTHDQDEALALSDTVAIMNGGRIVQAGSPREVYERPATPFVARFIGWKNVLRATAVDAASVRIADLLLEAATPGVPSGAPVDLLIRPEEVGVRAMPAGGERRASELPGTVVAQLYKATHFDLEIDAVGLRITARVTASATYGPGQRMLVEINKERTAVFAASSETCIAGTGP